ncbi:MAG: uroporphyrinogen-III synthase [Mariprofundus sp.]
MAASPLAGKHILITRASEQLPALAAMVRKRGAIPVAFPCLAVEPLTNEIMQAVLALEHFSDLLFTSCNGVNSVVEALRSHGMDACSVFASMRVAAVGRYTADCLQQYNIHPAIVPDTASQHGLIDAYKQSGLPRRLLFFRAEEGSDVLAEALAALSVDVVTLPAYRTVCPAEDAPEVVAMLHDGQIDAVLLGSARAATHYLQRLGDVAAAQLIVGISEKMAATVGQQGLRVQLVAKSASFEAMLDTVTEYFARHP